MSNRIEGTAAPVSRAVPAVGTGQVGRAGEPRAKPVEAAAPADMSTLMCFIRRSSQATTGLPYARSVIMNRTWRRLWSQICHSVSAKSR